MARIAAQAVAGYYKTPPHLVPLIAGLFDTTGLRDPEVAQARPAYAEVGYGAVGVLDPCAGDGEALSLFGQTVLGGGWPRSQHTVRVHLYAGELERRRYEALSARITEEGRATRLAAWTYHTDAMMLTWDARSTGVTWLYLNPPYEGEAHGGRLEHRFLERYTPAVARGAGYLIYIVPHGALKASAGYLAQQYDRLTCYRFPDADYAAFKQVVLVGQRRATPETVPDLVRDGRDQILGWAEAPETLPILAAGAPVYTVAPCVNHFLSGVQRTTFDVQGLRGHLLPWVTGRLDLLQPVPPVARGRHAGAKLGPIEELGLHYGVPDFLTRVHPVAMEVKPAYLATLLASGALDGLTITPNDAATGLPPILAKGVFQKYWVTSDTKTNAEGQVIGENQVERPILKVSVLSLVDYHYYDIDSGTLPTGATALAEMNVADLLLAYSDSLTQLVRQQFPPMHDPAKLDELLPLPRLGRDLYPVQVTAVNVLAKLLGQGTNPIATSEVGTGKTSMAVATAALLAPGQFDKTMDALKGLDLWNAKNGLRPVENVLVMCPPHLLTTWRKELNTVLPGARVIDVRKVSDLRDNPPWPALGADGPLPGHRQTFYLLSRETAKLGHPWEIGLDNGRCPQCGTRHYDLAMLQLAVDKGEIKRKQVEAFLASFISKRKRCEAQVPVSKRPAGRVARMLACLLATTYPDKNTVRVLVGAHIRPEKSTLPEVRQPAEAPDPTTGEGGRPAQPAAPQAPVQGVMLQRLMDRKERALRDLEEQAEARKPGAGEAAVEGARRSAWERASLRARLDGPWLGALIEATAALLGREYTSLHKHSGGWSAAATGLSTALEMLFWSAAAPIRQAHLEGVVRQLYALTAGHENNYYGAAAELRNLCRKLALLLLLDAPERVAPLVQAWRAQKESSTPSPYNTGSASPWEAFNNTLARLARGMGLDALDVPSGGLYSSTQWHNYEAAGRGKIMYKPGDGTVLRPGDPQAALAALEALKGVAAFHPGAVCGAPLYQATASRLRTGSGARWDGIALSAPSAGPRRIPLARYITTRMAGHFDLTILDEIQEFNNVGSAQEQAAHRLTRLGPCIGLTGSLMGGYASSLFANMWAFSPAFRKAFAWSEKSRFTGLYGYLRRYVAYKEPRNAEVVAYGKQSLKVETDGDMEIKMGGEAPGILPPFFTEFLLPLTAVVHKSDLNLELPALQEDVEYLDETAERPWTEADRDLLGNYVWLRTKILDRIKRDRFDPVLSGRLLGALMQVPSYLDLGTADVGNCLDPETGQPAYQIRYSENCGPHARELVVEVPLLPAEYITPKERWTIAAIKEELRLGRNVLLFVNHSGMEGRLMARYQRIFHEAGIPTLFLDTGRVGTKIREQWIIDNVLGKNVKVLIVNPEAVKTGLNCLTPYFKTAIWQELSVNALTWRQANGRIHRIGSDPAHPIWITVPVYDGTTQAVLLDLIARKIRVSKITDGLDASGTLEAAGAGGEDGVDLTDVLDMAKLLYNILTKGEGLTKHAKPVRRAVVVANGAGAADPPPPPALPPPVPFRELLKGGLKRQRRYGPLESELDGVAVRQMNLLDLIGTEDN